LLPSQDGFGSELQASNIITPIIDLTAAAEGSGLSGNLQQAQSFGSQTAYNINNTTTTLANAPGFWQIQGNMYVGAGGTISVNITDGAATKLLYRYVIGSGVDDQNIPISYVIWLAAGESINITANTAAVAYGSYRQIADSQGSLVQPSGYPL
jgi:hypothetical protein